jgi:hypothetical protein
MNYQDTDFMLKIMAVVGDYVYTPGVWCNYVRHSGGQITDCRTRRLWKRVTSLTAFLFQQSRHIPVTGKVMIVCGIMHLLRRGLSCCVKSVLKKLTTNLANSRSIARC